MATLDEQLRRHLDATWFREALTFTAASTGFSARLVEKDYFCSVVLHDMASAGIAVAFKGGTSLSKVHTDFYRMSEDLDFSLHIKAQARRPERRKTMEPLKKHLSGLTKRQKSLQVLDALRGFNNSTQYGARYGYESVVTGEVESIKVEVALREPHLQPLEEGRALTVLLDPFTEDRAVHTVSIQCLTVPETYAEKIRAALTRRAPAIRDFYDIDHAVRAGLIDPRDPDLLSLARRKVAVLGTDPIELVSERFEPLGDQVESELRPVLRPTDFDGFELKRAVALVQRIGESVLQKAPDANGTAQ